MSFGWGYFRAVLHSRKHASLLRMSTIYICHVVVPNKGTEKKSMHVRILRVILLI
jgi:hypothetical protein